MKFLAWILAAAGTGLLLTLAMPPIGFWPVGWIALVPLFVASRGQRFVVAFLLALVSCFVLGLLSVSGLLYAHRSSTGDPLWIYLGCAFFGAIVGLTSGLLAEVKTGDVRRLIALAAFAVLLEALSLKILRCLVRTFSIWFCRNANVV